MNKHERMADIAEAKAQASTREVTGNYYDDYEIFVAKEDGTFAYPYVAQVYDLGRGNRFLGRVFLPRPTKKYAEPDGHSYWVSFPGEGVYEIGIKRFRDKTKEVVSLSKQYVCVVDYDVRFISENSVLPALHWLEERGKIA